jgi:hypothetical protein
MQIDGQQDAPILRGLAEMPNVAVASVALLKGVEDIVRGLKQPDDLSRYVLIGI